MSRLALLLLLGELLLARTAIVTPRPDLADRLGELYDKLERITIQPDSIQHKLTVQMEKLNSVNPDELEQLSDEDEEVLSAMERWGLSPEQVAAVARDMQRDRLQDLDDYGDEAYADVAAEDGDYAMDGWEEVESTPNPEVTPAAITRGVPADFRATTFVAAVDPIAATNERPRILDDSSMTISERSNVRRSARANMGVVVRAGHCLTPQPRWLSVRQLAPAANIVYMPPCVQLHRCAPDSGCCFSEDEVCAPLEGSHVAIPFYLTKADGNMHVARMLFFNHTRCGCVSRERLARRDHTRVAPREFSDWRDNSANVPDWSTNDNFKNSRVAEWREPAKEADVNVKVADDEIEAGGSWDDASEAESETQREMDEEPTAPPQMRRCTCPAMFLARPTSTSCACVCAWGDAARRRGCLSLARGREHFGLRDRVCVSTGDCAPPACERGPYDVAAGRCPARPARAPRYRRLHARHV